MRNLPNIEKSAFKKGAYVGYATYKGESCVYHIRREGGDWIAHTIAFITPVSAPILRQRTLTEMSDSLADLALTPVNA